MMVAEHWAILQMIMLTVLMGILCISLIVPRGQLNAGMSLALSFPVGMGVTSVVCFVLGVLNCPLNAVFVKNTVLMAELILGLILFLRFRTRKVDQDLSALNRNQGSLPAWQRVGAVLLGLYLVYQFYLLMAVTLIFPLSTFDDITVTALKAKVFYYDSSMQALNSLPVPSYPLMVPFEMLWMSLNIGRWDDTLVKLVFPLMCFSFMFFQYCVMRELRGIFWALLYCALTISSALYHYHATIAYQDFLMMVFYSLPLLIMLLSLQRRKISLIPLAGLCSALGLLVKLEGFLYFSINLVMCCYLLYSLKEVSKSVRIRAVVNYVWPGVLLYGLYTGFVFSQGIVPGEGRFAFKESMSMLGQLVFIAKRYVTDMFLTNNWNMLWVILGVTLLVTVREATKSITHRFIFIVLILTFGLFIAIDLFTVNHISNPFILSRLLLHFYPVLPLWIVLLHSDFIVDKLNKKSV